MSPCMLSPVMLIVATFPSVLGTSLPKCSGTFRLVFGTFEAFLGRGTIFPRQGSFRQRRLVIGVSQLLVCVCKQGVVKEG